MSKSIAPNLSKWPFLLGDLCLVGFATVVIYRSSLPLTLREGVLSLLAMLAGAGLFILPFLREHQAAVKGWEADNLTTAVAQIQHLQEIKTHILNATGQWQEIQERSQQTVAAAKEITDRMKAEMGEVCAFLQKANDAEKIHLRLETEKLRRAEGEWLQTTVHILDHVFALHKAASCSGQPTLVGQLNQFQFACRDIVRRLGLSAFAPAAGDPFDGQVHQLQSGDTKLEAGARIAETLAPGYTYQGQLVRRALVRPEPQETGQNTPGQSSAAGKHAANL